MSPSPQTLVKLDEAIRHQFQERTLQSGLETAMAILELLGVGQERQIEDIKLTKLQLPNAERYDHWFQPHPFFRSDRSCFELVDGAELPIQAKFYWLQKKSKLSISGGVHFTPNWEDGEFTRTEGYKVGVDFFLTPGADAILIVLSDRGNLRIVELTERLRATQVEIFTAWMAAGSAKTADILHSTLWKTFQLQAVNEKFYVGVANAFTELTQHLDASVEVFSEDDSKQFANRLIGRLLFCWFLRKRDILDREQGYFDVDGLSASEYYRSRLEPLFFLTLNTPVRERAAAIEKFLASSSSYLSDEFQSKVVTDLKTPYLNGGLFENHASDHFGEPILSFPDGFFKRLFEHFDSYNFTTDESSPEYEQVAIDPEMLGKVFESLLATQVDGTGDQARQAVGAFYTPRNIVSYMCTEAIRKVLSEKFEGNKKALTAVDALLDTPDAQWASYGTNSRRDALKGFEKVLVQEIREITIFDPACGSGAFPMGMLQLLVKMHQRLTSESDLYKIKLHFLEKSLYGADIEPMAIEISRLRAWLSLIVDQEDPTNIHPLPNLDFHFLCCNSLIRLKDEDSGTLGFFENPIDQVAEIKTRYFYEDSPVVKSTLRQKYEKFRKLHSDVESDRVLQLMSYHPFNSDSPAEFFDRLEMFGIEEGFDILIGNPPYVRHEKIKYKNALLDYDIFASTADLYTYFYEMAAENCRPNGVVCFITSSKFGRAQYGANLRHFLTSELAMNFVVDFGGEHVFSAITNTWIIQCVKTKSNEETRVRILNSELEVQRSLDVADLSDKAWSFSGSHADEVLTRMENAGKTMATLPYTIFSGIKTGCDKAFVISEHEAKELIEKDKRNSEVIRPVLRGRDVFRYKECVTKDWLIVTADGINVKNDYPIIAKFLRKKDLELEGRASRRGDVGTSWMNLRPCAYYHLIEDEKIVFQRITDINNFTLSVHSEYLMNTLWMINGQDLELLLGILNSRLVRFYMKNRVAPSTGMATLEWTKFAVEQIPIPKITKQKEKFATSLRRLVKARLELGSKVPAEGRVLEEEIEAIVYQIYDIDMTEMSFVDESLRADNLL